MSLSIGMTEVGDPAGAAKISSPATRLVEMIDEELARHEEVKLQKDELEKRLDISSYSDYDKRVFGFIGERLLDVWIETNQISYAECPVLHMESQHWLKKGTAFLKRKFIR